MHHLVRVGECFRDRISEEQVMQEDGETTYCSESMAIMRVELAKRRCVVSGMAKRRIARAAEQCLDLQLLGTEEAHHHRMCRQYEFDGPDGHVVRGGTNKSAEMRAISKTKCLPQRMRGPREPPRWGREGGQRPHSQQMRDEEEEPPQMRSRVG